MATTPKRGAKDLKGRSKVRDRPAWDPAKDASSWRVVWHYCAKRFTREKQEAMGVFRLETLDGSIEAVAFPRTFTEYAVHLHEDAAVLVCADVKVKEDVRKRFNLPPDAEARVNPSTGEVFVSFMKNGQRLSYVYAE